MKIPGFNKPCFNESIEQSRLDGLVCVFLYSKAMVIPSKIQNLQCYVACVVPEK